MQPSWPHYRVYRHQKQPLTPWLLLDPVAAVTTAPMGVTTPWPWFGSLRNTRWFTYGFMSRGCMVTSFLESSETSEAIGKGAWWFNHQAYVAVSLTYQMTSRDFPWLVVCTDITVWRFCRHNPNPPFVLRSLVMIQSPCIILSSLVSIFRARPAALSKTFRRGREKFGLGTITDPECKLVTWLRAPPP